MSGPGLVKKLLFPAYADAGSNDTFGAQDEAEGEGEGTAEAEGEMIRSDEAGNAPIEQVPVPDPILVSEPVPLSIPEFSIPTGMEDVNEDENANAIVTSLSTDDLQSEATTTVQDNRTSYFFLNKSSSINQSTVRSNKQLTHAPEPLSPILQSESATNETLPLHAEQRVGATMSSSFFPTTAPPPRPIATRSASTTTRHGSVDQPFSGSHPPDLSLGLATTRVTASSLEQNPFAQEGVNEVRPFTLGGGSSKAPGQMDYNREDNEDGGLEEGQSEIMSDVLSTASEFGTVINISTRMEEVNAMAIMTPVAIAEEGSGSEQDEGEVDPSLSFPMFDENPQQSLASSSWDENYGVGNEKKTPATNPQASTSAAVMVSAAFRRIGTGVGTLGKSGAVSAPTTPRSTPRVEDYLKSANRSKDQKPPPSLLLRSPGSAAYYKASSKPKKPMLSPRFTDPRMARTQNSGDSAFSRHGSSLASPLKFARGCFSFDNTTGDERNSIQEGQLLRPRISESMSLSSPMKMQLEPKSTHVRHLMHSKSWDVGSTALPSNTGGAHPIEYASAFRAIPGNTRVLHAKTNFYQPDHREPTTIKSSPDFSPAISTMQNAMALRTPQRVVIEREDALDILACLVERSITFEKEPLAATEGITGNEEAKESVVVGLQIDSTADEEVTADDDKVSTFAEVGSRTNARIKSPPKSRRKVTADLDILESGSLSSNVVETLNELRNISKVHDDESDHENRMEMLDELLRSHVYAGEMKRAARSASTWLRSIGRSSNNSMHEPSSLRDSTDDGDDTLVETPGRSADNQADRNILKKDSNSDEKAFDEKMDVLTIRAMLHSVELKLKDKADESLRLNAELTECRAEIGRLKSVSNSGFRSPNCSILDDDEEDSEVSDVGADVVESDKFSISERTVTQTGDTDAPHNQSHDDGDATKEETRLLKAALVEANNTIRKLHAKGQEQSLHSGDDFWPSNKAPVVPIPYKSKNDSTQDTLDSLPRELIETNAESFVTKWTTEPPLPGPPDHNLNSPIVTGLLKQWTLDSAMHHSLLTWITRILHGAEPDSVPPLTISSLDRKVRDGMLMHVLPLLYKRPDVLLDVQTRAQRKTTFDISVTVQQNRIGDAEASYTPKANNTESFAYNARHTDTITDRSLFVDDAAWKSTGPHGDSEVGTSSIAHSAVTAHISNSAPLVVPVESTPASRSFNGTQMATAHEASASSGYESSGGANSQRSGQAGLMSAINSTFGGLLNRGKKVPSQIGVDGHNPSAYVDSDEAQPYQRVLSCPPGRIGVTFVQYRGHAMVSDVSPESPLSGWVFASDILIAIDEVPVSGMRVRDIVKLLTARKDRQRALRVISSHAMNEFTLNTSVLSDAAM